MTLFKGKKSNRRKSRSNHHRWHARTLGLEGLERREMLAAISGLDSAPVAEQQAGYSGQAEIAVQMERENSIECLQVPMPGQPTEPFFRPNPSGLSSSPTGSLGFDLEGQGTNDAAFAKYDGYVPYDVESHGTNGAIFVQYDLEGQGTDSITKRIDKVAEGDRQRQQGAKHVCRKCDSVIYGDAFYKHYDACGEESEP